MRTLARSAVVGIAATVVDLLALLVLVQVVGLPPEVANVPALAFGVIAQFVGNKIFAFRCRDARPRVLAAQTGLFAAVEAGALVLNALAFHLLVASLHVPYPAARLVGSSVVYFGYSYPLWGKIFGKERG
jgi:putative flippase GtrA